MTSEARRPFSLRKLFLIVAAVPIAIGVGGVVEFGAFIAEPACFCAGTRLDGRGLRQ